MQQEGVYHLVIVEKVSLSLIIHEIGTRMAVGEQRDSVQKAVINTPQHD